MISDPHTRTDLPICIDQIKVVVAKSQINHYIPDWREMILRIKTGLPTLAPTSKGGKAVRVTAAIEEKAFALAKPHQIDTRFENTPRQLSAPADMKTKRRLFCRSVGRFSSGRDMIFMHIISAYRWAIPK